MPGNEFRIPASSAAPALARAHVASAMTGSPASAIDDVVLLTSELVTNAVRHTSSAALGDVVLRIEVDPVRVRVEVLNPGSSFDPPVPETPSTTGTGLGLFLVDELATAWGVESEGPRTKVWFDLATAEGERARSA